VPYRSGPHQPLVTSQSDLPRFHTFSHYLYASMWGTSRLKVTAPWEQYWMQYFPYSDERHWDNMGVEVLPASDVPGNWSNLASRISMPAFVPLD
jgi:hypothetical protein